MPTGFVIRLHTSYYGGCPSLGLQVNRQTSYVRRRGSEVQSNLRVRGTVDSHPFVQSPQQYGVGGHYGRVGIRKRDRGFE